MLPRIADAVSAVEEPLGKIDAGIAAYLAWQDEGGPFLGPLPIEALWPDSPLAPRPLVDRSFGAAFAR